MLGVVPRGTRAGSRMRAFPAAVQGSLRCDTLRRTIYSDADKLVNLVHLENQASKVGPETALECARCAI